MTSPNYTAAQPGETALRQIASSGHLLTNSEMQQLVGQACRSADYWRGKKVILIIPDSTRTAPVGAMFKLIFQELAGKATRLDILVALGTHQPMSEEAICQRLDLTQTERESTYREVRFFNHEWDNPAALRNLGVIPASEIHQLSGGRFSMDVPVTVNERLFKYDQILILGPVFPHEVVGFSGGNKYLFPGVGGPEVLNFFHWLAAVVSNVGIIGNQWTPVRSVVDRAGSMVKISKGCFSMVVKGSGLVGLFYGSPEASWDHAAQLSAQYHIEWKSRPFRSILSCAPAMYDELWVGGKCMYKLEPVLADNGELIIYAPHIREVSLTHGRLIREIGYHCREYFLADWDRFKNHPWGVLAHSTHVFGDGTFRNGVETPRARVILATGISETECRQINLGYRDWRTIRVEDFQNREAEGILYVPKAGETLYRLKT